MKELKKKKKRKRDRGFWVKFTCWVGFSSGLEEDRRGEEEKEDDGWFH